jgi:1-acyl-sn-glycerol-3-phosphate acyltransferase
MTSIAYNLVTRFCWWVTVFWTLRCRIIRREAVEGDGPLLIACTHLSHLDPFLLSTALRKRPIDWVARIEFWKYRPIGWFLNTMRAIPCRRFGVPVSMFRIAIRRLHEGGFVGICPEGGVANGMRSVLRGAPIKKGVCLLSYRTGVPVLPCVMLGTDKLNCVPPWIPYRRGSLWIAFGPRLIYPQPDHPDRRAAREAMAAELSREFQALYQEALKEFGLCETDVP